MKLSLLAFCTTLGTVAALGAPQSFDFKDPKGVNNVVFKLDAPLESINGSASGISGSLQFDPENPSATKGRIVVSTASMTVPNPMMNTHLHGTNWMDAAKYPEITFDVGSLSNVKTEGNVTTADVNGTFVLHGVSKEITVPAKLTYLKGKLGDRVPNMKGDLLVVRSNFSVNREDFNIQKGQNADKVSTSIELSLSVAGACAASQ